LAADRRCLLAEDSIVRLAATLLLSTLYLLAADSRPLSGQAATDTQPPTNTQPQEAGDLELRVQRSVEQLDDPDRATREAAERQLTELGEVALPYLPEVTPDTSAETAERLARIRGVLDQAAVNAMIKPSRISLMGELSLSEILEQMQQQTGNRVIDFTDRFGQQPRALKLNVDIHEMEFWPALDRLLDQAEMTTYSFTGEPRTLGIVAAPPEQIDRVQASAYAGVFRIEPTEIQSQRNLRRQDGSSVRMRLEILWEPRVTPVLIRQPYDQLEITADDGNSITSTATGAAEVPIQSTVAGIDLVVPLQLEDRSVRAIKRLKGRLFALVPGRDVTFEFGDLSQARNVSQRRGGMEVVLERVRQNGAVYEFRIRLRLLNADQSFQSHLDWASNNEVYLINEGGEKIDNPNFERYLEREREIGFGYLFPLSGDIKDYRLVYRSPASILTIPVDYELNDIPLP
jgi:hypothetical protein